MKRSKVLLTTVILESILSIWALFYFNYLDRLNYADRIITPTTDLALLIKDMYTSTWWALIILTICLITIFSLVCLIYNDIKFQLISILLWLILFILAINFNDNWMNVMGTLAIFIPIITVNILGYFNQKKLIKK